MFKAFLVLALFSSVAFAENDRKLLLEKHTKSGRVAPEDSFVKDCLIYRNGDVEISVMLNTTITVTNTRISHFETWEIRELIRLARHFQIVSNPARCDTGENILTGYQGMKPVLIDELRSCTADKHRKRFVADRLRDVAEQICTF